jgi:hypothetical protein
MKLRKGNGKKRELLILEHLEGETYRDSTGKIYNVQEINSEQSASADENKP